MHARALTHPAAVPARVFIGVCVVVALFGSGASWAATGANDSAASGVEEPQIEPLRSWEVTGSWRGAFGYKENLLLSAVRSENSAFVQTEGELFWWRLPTDRFEALAFTNASFTRYFQSDENPREWQAFAHGEARWFLSPTWLATATAEGYHLDQIFDLSATTAERVVAPLAVTGLLTNVQFRWQPRGDTWVELKPAIQRDRYRGHRDDNAQQFARLTAARAFAQGRFEIALAGQILRRTYDHRPQYTRSGFPLPGTKLVFEQHEGDATLRATWDRAERWTSATSATLTKNSDNGSGFFDYEYRSVRHELTWARAPWRVRLTAKVGRYDYAVQQIGVGIRPQFRQHDESLVQLRVERELNDKARFFADVLAERSRSNDPLAVYDVNTTSAGVEWTF